MAETFRDGKKYVDGRVVEPQYLYEALSSNGTTVYTATVWQDGGISCNCTGWATSKKTPKACKHTKAAADITGDVLITRDPMGKPVTIQASTGRRGGRVTE